MKICVLADSGGEIIGTARNDPFNSQVQVGIMPDEGQTVYDIEVPDEFAQLSAAELHERLQEQVKKCRDKQSKH